MDANNNNSEHNRDSNKINSNRVYDRRRLTTVFVVLRDKWHVATVGTL